MHDLIQVYAYIYIYRSVCLHVYIHIYVYMYSCMLENMCMYVYNNIIYKGTTERSTQTAKRLTKSYNPSSAT